MMNEMGIYANLSGHDKGYSSYKGKVGKTAPNLLKRDFNAEHSLEKAGTDVTEFELHPKSWTKLGKGYFYEIRLQTQTSSRYQA